MISFLNKNLGKWSSLAIACIILKKCFLLQVDDRLTLAERNERLQNQLRSLKDELSHTTVESGETTMDRIHKENVKQGRDKYKTLREVRKGNTKRRVDQFENM